ncbi:MAG: DNA polymerase I [Bacteroidetes bacterium]|nr:MAG: DNA polymerase I [Bacteroidota bacterium]
MTDKKLFLLDAYALIFRAYYAFIKNPRYNSKGLNTSAILGFTNTLYEILRKEKPSHIAVVFDPPTGNFRSEIFPEYKAHRDATPEDIIKSVPHIKDIIKAFNIPIYEVPGFEADDTIGTLAKKAEKAGFTTYMMTPDKDFGQLVSDNIFMYKPKRGGNDAEILGKKEICEKYGIENPEQVIDILAIWGDAADNIPGIPGVGEKTSMKLIQKYKSVDGIYEHLNELKGKQKENIENSKDLVKLSKELVTISLDVPVDINEQDLEKNEPDYKKLEALFKEFEFGALAKRIIPGKQETVSQGSLFGGQEVTTAPDTNSETYTDFKNINNSEHNYLLIESEDDIKNLVSKLEQTKEFCFDTETTGTNPHLAELVGISFSYRKFEAYYIPVPKDKELLNKIINLIKPVLENPSIKKIGQNIKYDIIILSNHGINVAGKLFDTMLAHYLLEPAKRHNMTVLAQTLLNYNPVSIETLIGKKGKNQLSMRNVPLEQVKEYAGEDADITLRLKEVLEKELAKDEKLNKLAEDIEFPLVYVLADTEKNGVKISTEQLQNYEKELTERINKTEEKIYKLAGTKFNIASPKQMGTILFDTLKITDNPKKTKTGQYATGEDELLKLKDKHEIINLILDYRGFAKLLSTYVKALPELINPKTGKIHTSYNQAVTATGRLSSANPNLQNIPIRTDDGKRIREAFIPSDENHILFAADYSQIELRIMAHLSKDKNMLEAFNNKEDIHASTAAKIFGVKLEDVTKEMRSKAKSANFGIIYGISAFGLSQNLNIPRSEAKELIDGYFASYPDVKNYMDESIRIAREQEYVSTISGRKRQLKNINSRNSLLRSNDERNAINAPIQGTAADIIKIAMINIFAKFKTEKLNTKMILQVHDELVFDVPKNETEKTKQIVIEEMEHAYKLSVDLIVDSNFGENWLKAH